MSMDWRRGLLRMQECWRQGTAPWRSLLGERRCLLCRAPFTPPAEEAAGMAVPTAAWLCPACRPALVPFTGARCPACGEPLPLEQHAVCGRCLNAPPPWDACAYYGVYRNALRGLLLDFKFGGQTRLARFLAELLLESMTCLPACDCIVPVPSHASRLRERGVSQTCLLAQELSRLSGMPTQFSALTRSCATPQQAQLGAAARAEAPRGSFAAGAGLTGLRVLLVDDIVTTGATARHAALCLRGGGAAAVRLLSVARAAY